MAQHEQRPIVALIYDFDGTLSPGNMQEYDFIPAVGKSNREFWEESNETAREQDGDPILAYMYRMLHEAKSSGKSLRYEAFVQSGARIGLYDGVREWFSRINAYGASKGLEIHHFINSSGLREMIEGTPIAHEFRKIYACSFLYDVDGVAYWPAVAVNYTNKTQFIFKINKGIESVYDSHRINEYIEEEERPVPFRRISATEPPTFPVCGWSSSREDTRSPFTIPLRSATARRASGCCTTSGSITSARPTTGWTARSTASCTRLSTGSPPMRTYVNSI